MVTPFDIKITNIQAGSLRGMAYPAPQYFSLLSVCCREVGSATVLLA